MLQLQDLQLSFPDKVLFDSLSWTVKPGQRIGLVGDNGVGKTTLLKIITGKMEIDSGKVVFPKDQSIGYLAQDFSESSEISVRQFVREAAAHVEDLERRIEITQSKLFELAEDSAEHEDAVLTLASLQERYELVRGFSLDARVAEVLKGLGFDDEAAARPMNTFSGGWQMRAALARLLVQEPDVLLLDEPTNHLDTDTVEWLERFLKSYPGSLVVVSHDRYFLDRMVQRIAELEHGKIRDYVGNYSKYRETKEVLVEEQLANQARQAKKLAQTERFIERFRYKASKAKQVQSRVRALSKVDRIEVEQETAGIQFRFPACERSGEIVVSGVQLAKRYEDNQVFERVDFEIRRGERVALVGPNGAGKSTLMRLIAGFEEPSHGTVKLGHQVKLACYTQEFEAQLITTHSVLEELARDQEGLGENELRNLLGCFRFPGQAVFKSVGVLSGGEKSRLAVAKLLLSKANFLVLDEPTNHLDIKAKDVLQDALSHYEGTVLIVSHDRYFLDGVVERVLELRDGVLHHYLGSYSDSLERRERQLAGTSPQQKATDKKPATTSSGKERHEQRKAQQKVLRQAERQVAKLEEEIQKVEAELEQYEKELLDEKIYSQTERLTEVTSKHGALRKRRDELYRNWEEVQEQLEQAKEELERLS